MQSTDRDWRSPEACQPLHMRAIHHTAHLPHRDPHRPLPSGGDPAEGHLSSWETAWIDLGGEG